VEQPITTVELILGDLTVAEVGRAAFLLLIVWSAWIPPSSSHSAHLGRRADRPERAPAARGAGA
jgi:hypothetical protein